MKKLQSVEMQNLERLPPGTTRHVVTHLERDDFEKLQDNGFILYSDRRDNSLKLLRVQQKSGEPSMHSSLSALRVKNLRKAYNQTENQPTKVSVDDKKQQTRLSKASLH